MKKLLMPKKKTIDFFATQRRIKALKQHTVNNSYPTDFLPALRVILKGLPFKATTLENEFIFRSRLHDTDKLFSHIDELKYPRGEYIKEKGRFNEIGESIFYGSLCELGTIIESHPTFDQLFTIIKIRKIAGLPLFLAPIAVEKFPFTPIPKNENESIIFNYLYGEVTKIIQDKREYNSTIAIGHHFLRTTFSSDTVQKNLILCYPSAVGKEICNTTTYNLAMRPETFDSNFKIIEAIVYSLSNEQTEYVLNPYNIANIEENGNLIWKYNYKEMLEKIKNKERL